MQKFINIDPMEPGTVFESTGLLHGNDELSGGATVVDVETGSSRNRDNASPAPAAVASFEVGRQSELMAPVGVPHTSAASGARKERGMKEPKSVKQNK